MSKMFRIGVLSVAMCLGVSAGSLKADFDADLLNVLSVDERGFPEEVLSDPVYWGELCALHKAYKGLYGNFCRDLRNIETEFTKKTASLTAEDPDAFAERAFCLLQLSRDLYGKVSEYAFVAYDFDGDNGFKNVEPLLLSECRYVFARRLLELSRFILHRYMRKFGFDAFVDTKDRKPDEKVLAEVLKPFAKGDASKELQLDDNNSQLIQSLHVLSKVFDKFLRNNDEVSGKIKETFGEPLSSWFNVPMLDKNAEYREYIFKQQEILIVALRNLSRSVSDRVDRMLSVKNKLSIEQKKEALPFFKKEKDVGALLEDTESFRIKEKEGRKSEQEAFAESKKERKRLGIEITKTTNMLKSEKRELNKFSENSTGILDKKELENKVQKLGRGVETLKKQINKLPYPSVKSKHKMQREAAKKDISKDEHDRAVFANYVQLPYKCRAFQNAFLYYQTIMWNVFTDDVTAMRGYGQRIYGELKIKMPELTEDFEEEYNSTVSPRKSSREKHRSFSFDKRQSKIRMECEESVLINEESLNTGFMREDKERERGKSVGLKRIKRI